MFPRITRSRFLAGFVCGVAAVFAARLVINETRAPDLLIAPLLMSDSSADADAIVVLGGAVIGDCVPNTNSMRRVIRGARLFKAGRAPVFLVTGGAVDRACPVADAMSGFARELGVPPDTIVAERRSHSTWENAVMSAPLLRERQVRRILLVTDRLHMRRAAAVFVRQGFEVEPSAVPIFEGHEDNVSMLAAGMREAAALAYYRLRGRLGAAGPASQHPANLAPHGTGNLIGHVGSRNE
jgi:uncharacterized SAM-binding protein YcdF (DUF218 family)